MANEINNLESLRLYFTMLATAITATEIQLRAMTDALKLTVRGFDAEYQETDEGGPIAKASRV